MEKCEHINILLAKKHCILNPEKWLCSVCGTTESVWACLTCANVACGRFNEGHALTHFTTTKHPIAFELNDKFVYCYLCDDYVLSDNVAGDISVLRAAIDAITTQSFSDVSSQGQFLLRSYSYTDVLNRSHDSDNDRHITASCHFKKVLLGKTFAAWVQYIALLKAEKIKVNSVKRLKRDIAPKLSSTSFQRKWTLIPGVTGLRNLGNTCYFNSILQALGHLDEFRQYFLQLNFYSDLNPMFSPSMASLSPASTTPISPQHTPASPEIIQSNLSYTRRIRRLNTMDFFQHLSNENTSTPKRRPLLQGGLNGGGTPGTSNSVQDAGTSADFFSLCQELHGLFRVMWSGKWVQVSAHGFLQALWNSIPAFKGYRQHDAQEFLCEMLDTISNELKVTNEDEQKTSIVSDTFQGEITSSVTCLECRCQSSTHETFMDLSLEFPPRYQVTTKHEKLAVNECLITEMLETFTDVEVLEGRIYGCEKCNNAKKEGKFSPTVVYTAAQKQILISKLPQVLRLHLKRFRWCGRNHREKIATHVTFDSKLNMSAFCAEGVSSVDCSYRLSAVVIHHGRGFGSGHYTSYCWSSEADSWIYCNDSKVELCALSDVLQSQAYILFYTQNSNSMLDETQSYPLGEELSESMSSSQVVDEDITFNFRNPLSKTFSVKPEGNSKQKHAVWLKRRTTF